MTHSPRAASTACAARIAAYDQPAVAAAKNQVNRGEVESGELTEKDSCTIEFNLCTNGTYSENAEPDGKVVGVARGRGERMASTWTTLHPLLPPWSRAGAPRRSRVSAQGQRWRGREGDR